MIPNSTPVQDRPEFVKALIYGQAGAGKTRFAADADRPFWFDFESSTETLRHWPEYVRTPVKKPSGIMELFGDIKRAVTDPEIGTIVIDSITTALDFYMRQEAEARASKRDKYEFWEADYKRATQVFSELFMILQNAPIHVVIIGHERITRDADTGRITEVFPDITPRLQQSVTRLVNIVAYLEVENSEAKGVTTRKLYVNRTKRVEAKNRLNISETYIENPTWKAVFGGG